MAIRIILIDSARKEIGRLRLSDDSLDGCEVLDYDGFSHLYNGLDKGRYVFRRVKTYIATVAESV